MPLVGTFLLAPGGPDAAQPAGDPGPPPHGGRMRYTITLRVFKLDQQGGTFRFADHLEQVPDWADSLIADVGPEPRPDGAGGLGGVELRGIRRQRPVRPDHRGAARRAAGSPGAGPGRAGYVGRVPLPEAARALPVLGQAASLTISVTDRTAGSGALSKRVKAGVSAETPREGRAPLT